jgi:hypothetical protein
MSFVILTLIKFFIKGFIVPGVPSVRIISPEDSSPINSYPDFDADTLTRKLTEMENTIQFAGKVSISPLPERAGTPYFSMYHDLMKHQFPSNDAESRVPPYAGVFPAWDAEPLPVLLSAEHIKDPNILNKLAFADKFNKFSLKVEDLKSKTEISQEAMESLYSGFNQLVFESSKSLDEQRGALSKNFRGELFSFDKKDNHISYKFILDPENKTNGSFNSYKALSEAESFSAGSIYRVLKAHMDHLFEKLTDVRIPDKTHI